MPTILKFATVVLGSVLVVAANAEAGPCATAERGTYLSNVCWLIEYFTNGSLQIAEANAEDCTLSLSQPKNTDVDFMKADGDLRITFEGRHTMCWTLFGIDGIVRHPSYVGDDLHVCGKRVEPSRIEDAMKNLFTKYCSIEEQEF